MYPPSVEPIVSGEKPSAVEVAAAEGGGIVGAGQTTHAPNLRRPAVAAARGLPTQQALPGRMYRIG